MLEVCGSNERNVVLFTGLVAKQQYNRDEMKMYPVYKDVGAVEKLETEPILEILGKQEKVLMGEFFLRADYQMVKKLAERKKPFNGKIITKNLPYHVQIEVRQNKRYIQKLHELFGIFQKNRIPWRTPCAPCFFKMFEMYIIETDLPWYEEIEKIEIDFEEYKDYIDAEMIPVWNIENVSLITDVRPFREEDSGLYHHVINERRMENESQYLVIEDEVEISSCQHMKGLHILCTTGEERIWQLYRVEMNIPEKIKEKMFQNHAKNEGLCTIRTIGGIHRMIYGLGYQERFELVKVEMSTSVERKEDIYIINDEWEELLAERNGLNPLKLVFKSKVNDYLQTDILSYLVSEIQRNYPEYYCIAELI